jgi:dTDP-L-rhamnose 4-epimerase
LVLEFAAAYGLRAVALRYFNVYGPRQALSNPYTGVMAIFLARLFNGKSPVIFEDGLQGRDFVHVSDIVKANLLALGANLEGQSVFNVGRGEAVTIMDVATSLAEIVGVEISPETTNRYRAGDIRHCVADIDNIRLALGFSASVDLRSGLRRYVESVRGAEAFDRTETAMKELMTRGLILGDEDD